MDKENPANRELVSAWRGLIVGGTFLVGMCIGFNLGTFYGYNKNKTEEEFNKYMTQEFKRDFPGNTQGRSDSSASYNAELYSAFVSGQVPKDFYYASENELKRVAGLGRIVREEFDKK